jgi:asparagine synthetase B (glutamine-hydrolysing)
MAGVYAILNGGTAERLDAVERRLRFSNEASRRFVGGVSYLWLGHDDPDRFAPAYDAATGVRVVASGRVAWPAQAVERARALPYDGGIHNRLVLERYLGGGAAAVAPYNGSAAILIWDPREEVVHLWTDQFGYHPAFLYHGDREDAIFTSFPDSLLADPEARLTPDDVSRAEFLRAWRATPPHTYYREVKSALPATNYQWSRKPWSAVRSNYWRPFESEPFPSIEEAAESLAEAVGTSVRERTAAAERPALFISGGADSRVMLFAAYQPDRVTGINLFESPTFESETARRLCTRAGARYVGFPRDNDYYPRLLPELAKWSGAMWSVEDGHYLGVRHLIEEAKADLVMTACTTDWVFKGYGMERTARRMFGRDLPFKRFLHQRVDGFLPNYPRHSPPRHAAEIQSRFDEWFAGTPKELKTPRDFLIVEDRRIRPATYTVSVSGPIMYRVFPYDTFLADSRVAECYSRTLPEWKINGDLWGLAASRICGAASDIVDSNFGWQVGSGVGGRFFAFARGWARRKLDRLRPPRPVNEKHPPSTASWPEFGWYVRHSGTLRDFWNSATNQERTRLAELWGSSPWDEPLESWATHPNDFLRIATTLSHWRTTGI